MQKSTRYLSLDMWRGIACLAVVVFHGAYFAVRTDDPAKQPHDAVTKSIYAIMDFGWVGVPIFFVISGYCIAAASDNLRTKGHAVSQFFLRRFRRIYPPYWALLGCGVALLSIAGYGTATIVLTDAPHLTTFQWFGNITLTQTWLRHFQPTSGTMFEGLFFNHAWTLCYEEQFYAVCGFALLLSRKYFFWIVAVVTLVVWALQTRLGYSIQPYIDGFFFDGSWLMFAAGVLVYYVANLATRRKAIALNAILLLMVAWQVQACYRNGGEARFTILYGLLFAVLASILYRWDKPIYESKIAKPLTWCGLMCYSMYLVHYPICNVIAWQFDRIGINGPWPTILVTVPVCIIASIVVARAFYLVVERRFLNSPIPARKAYDGT